VAEIPPARRCQTSQIQLFSILMPEKKMPSFLIKITIAWDEIQFE